MFRNPTQKEFIVQLTIFQLHFGRQAENQAQWNTERMYTNFKKVNRLRLLGNKVDWPKKNGF